MQGSNASIGKLVPVIHSLGAGLLHRPARRREHLDPRPDAAAVFVDDRQQTRATKPHPTTGSR